MAHLHSVYDNDTHFKIDPVTRQIANESGKVILMQNDHNSERFTFEIPRYIDGHDMSVCNKVEVHFINLKADKTEKHADVYPVEDLQISPASEDVVICSWLISQNATKYAGSLNFVLRYACLTGSVIDYQWYTDIHRGISVSESISNTESVATEYSDILEAWRDELIASGGVSDEQIAQAVEDYMAEHPVSGGNVNYNPVEKTEDMTQPVGVDADGRLWVAPVGSGSGGDTPVVPGSHGIVWDLVNVTSSNNIASVTSGASLVAVLTPADGYTLGNVIVTMGGEVLTGVWNADTATVTIPSVTGDVVISCAGVAVPTEVTETLAWMGKGSGQPTFTAIEGSEDYAITGTVAFKENTFDYFAIAFPGEISGGHVKIEWDTTILSNIMLYAIFTTTPIKTTDTELNHVGWSGRGNGASGTSSATSGTLVFSRDKGSTATYLNGVSEFDCPDGYYPYLMFRRDSGGSVEPVASNGGVAKWFAENAVVTVTKQTTAEVEETSAAELVDNDYAMDYGVAMTSIVTDESANTKVSIDKTFAAVIEEAKNAWLSEANGDIDKIPLIIHTDQHSNFSKPLWDFIGEIVDWYDVGKVINLGDTVGEYGGNLLRDSGLESYSESMESVPYSKRIEIFGNHDTWGNNEDGTGRFTPQNYLHKYFRNIYARRFDNHGNFVTYDDNYNVKYVVVSGFAYDSEKGGYSHYIIPSATIDRIIAELEKADGYDVVILSHVPLSGVNHKSLNDLWRGRKVKTSGSVTDEYGVAHEFDFTGCDGELLCGLHGHNHEDGHAYIGELLDVWFDAYYIAPNAIHFVLVDRPNGQLNVWKVDNTPQFENYQIPFVQPETTE